MEHTTLPALRRGLRCHSIRRSRPGRAAKSTQEIWLLVPTGKTAIEASERDGPRDGRHATRCISVSAPFIAVVPACALMTPGSAADPQGLVIALDSRLLKETSRRVFGTVVREVPRWFKAWDPFLREAADTLAPLHRSRIADSACLDVFADVIALHLVCHYGRRTDAHDSGTSLTPQKLTLVELFIHEHIAETIQVEQLAALVHMSPSHFARAFKKATGCPPHFYVTTERLKFARFMLSGGSLPLIEVAERSGFHTQQHFTEVFHRYTGSTPRSFRLSQSRTGDLIERERRTL
jgi:AraC family transcriptional regulator